MRSVKVAGLFGFFLFLYQPASASTTFTVAPYSGVGTISPLSYGSNHYDVNGVKVRRFGGNRSSAYNWENNASNAGNDYGPNNSDFYLLSQVGLPQNASQAPGAVPVRYAQNFRASGTLAELITIQSLGFVSADGSGIVTAGQAAPSSRWKQVLPHKPGWPASLSLTPDKTDGFVYMDEQVNFLVNTFGLASAGGIRYYSIDNEPGIWSNTHALAHPAAVTYAEIYAKSSATAQAILDIDASAEVFAPASYGWGEFSSMSGASDSAAQNGTYGWFVSYFLAKMNTASVVAGKRLLHYLDLHWYPEAQGNGNRIDQGSPDDVSQLCSVARMQAPRSLWDASYSETSWITSSGSGPIQLLNRMQSAINTHYPGTKLAISEYDYGAWDHISGGIAQADVLGIFGKYGVAAMRWGNSGANSYVQGAFDLYLNYNGAGAAFGDLSCSASTSDSVNTSIYAAKRSTDYSTLTLVALNKSWSTATTGNFNLTLNAGESITGITVYRLVSGTASLAVVAAPAFGTATFSDNLPAVSATLYEVQIFRGTPTPTSTLSPTRTPSPTASHTATVTRTQTPTFSVSPTLTVTATFTDVPPGSTFTETPLMTATPTPTVSPTGSPSPTLTALGPFAGDHKILNALGVPNPGAKALAILLAGPADEVLLRLYSEGYTLVQERKAGPWTGGWNQLALDPAWLLRAPNGAYFFTVTAKRKGSTDSLAKGRLYLLR